jgi:hypothetical protein
MTHTEKKFVVQYSKLNCWSVSYFRTIKWNWPAKYIQPLSTAIIRVQEVSNDPTVPIIEKISFGGLLSVLDNEDNTGYKGRLFLAKAGQMIYSKIRVKQGSLCIIPEDYSIIAVSSEYPVYQIRLEVVTPIFLELLLRSRALKFYLDGLSHGGSTKTRIHPEQFEQLDVPIPPPSVQQAIVDYWVEAQRQYTQEQQALVELVDELNQELIGQTASYPKLIKSRVFTATYSQLSQWDLKGGRAASFIAANPRFVRLGEYTSECTELVRPWDEPEKVWPIYGVNNKDGVFLSSEQAGSEFNAAYKKVEKDWFFHNPTRANVGSLGIVPEVPSDAITSPEYQVWRLTGGFLPGFMALMLRTDYFLSLVAFNRVGGVKQRMYYANFAEIRVPMIEQRVQKRFAERRKAVLANIEAAKQELAKRKLEVEEMILGVRPVK